MTFGNPPVSALKNTTLDTKVTKTLQKYRSKEVLTRNDFLDEYEKSRLKIESAIFRDQNDYGLVILDRPSSPPTCGYSKPKLWRLAAKAAGLPSLQPTCYDKLKKSNEKLPKVMEKIEKLLEQQAKTEAEVRQKNRLPRRHPGVA